MFDNIFGGASQFNTNNMEYPVKNPDIPMLSQEARKKNSSYSKIGGVEPDDMKNATFSRTGIFDPRRNNKK